MDENKPKKSPWGQLAQDLGAEPSSEAFQRSQPPAVEIPATEATDQENDPETPPQSPSDWNALAGSLGLEVPEPAQPEPSEPEIASEPADEPSVEPEASSAEEVAISSESPGKDESFGIGISREAGFSEEDSDEDNYEEDYEEDYEDSADPLPPLPSEVDQIMSEGDWDSEEDTDEDLANENEDETGMSGNAAKNAFDALFNADGSALSIPSPEWVREKPLESAEGVVDQVAPEARANDSEDSNQENDGIEDDEKEQRPKRKRSRRRRGRGRGRKTEAEQTPTEETAEGQDNLNGEDRGDPSDEASSDDSEKPRHRRPRRRSRRSASADSPTRTGDSKETDDSMESLSYGDNELAEGSDSSHRDSTGHRNMPTWTEALSTIIEGNLELHSKAPSRQGSSRGRGRGRGGRGRKKS